MTSVYLMATQKIFQVILSLPQNCFFFNRTISFVRKKTLPKKFTVVANVRGLGKHENVKVNYCGQDIRIEIK